MNEISKGVRRSKGERRHSKVQKMGQRAFQENGQSNNIYCVKIHKIQKMSMTGISIQGAQNQAEETESIN